MKIAIIGAGGVGGYFGAKLAQAGNDVTFIARGEHLKAMQANGLIVKSIHGDFHVNSIKATDNIANLDSPELVIIAVKAWQVKDIAKELAPVINANTTILPLENGVSAVEELQEIIGNQCIIGGLCRIFSKIEVPGVISHVGVDPTIVFGEMNNVLTDRVLQIKDTFDKAGFKAVISKDISADLWKKFIAICVSALLAVTKTTYGELRELPQTRQMMIDLVNEIYNLSQKIGIKIEPDFVSKTVAFVDTFPYDSTASLTRDVWEGKPSEIEYQNGTVVKLGEKYGVATPINTFVYQCILPMELKARANRA